MKFWTKFVNGLVFMADFSLGKFLSNSSFSSAFCVEVLVSR